MKYRNILVVGSTRAGKSMAEVRRLLAAAHEGASIVLIDPHRDSLGARLFEQLVAAGLAKRVLL